MLPWKYFVGKVKVTYKWIKLFKGEIDSFRISSTWFASINLMKKTGIVIIGKTFFWKKTISGVRCLKSLNWAKNFQKLQERSQHWACIDNKNMIHVSDAAIKKEKKKRNQIEKNN